MSLAVECLASRGVSSSPTCSCQQPNFSCGSPGTHTLLAPLATELRGTYHTTDRRSQLEAVNTTSLPRTGQDGNLSASPLVLFLHPLLSAYILARIQAADPESHPVLPRGSVSTAPPSAYSIGITKLLHRGPRDFLALTALRLVPSAAADSVTPKTRYTVSTAECHKSGCSRLLLSRAVQLLLSSCSRILLSSPRLQPSRMPQLLLNMPRRLPSRATRLRRFH